MQKSQSLQISVTHIFLQIFKKIFLESMFIFLKKRDLNQNVSFHTLFEKDDKQYGFYKNLFSI